LNLLRWALFPLGAFTLGCAATAPSAPEASSPIVVVVLQATSLNAGQIGRATLVPQGGGTDLSLYFSGVPPYVSRPVHVYTFVHPGSCGDLAAQPAYSLNEVVLVSTVSGRIAIQHRGELRLAHRVPVPVADLLREPHAIVLRTAPADGDQIIFCGDLPGP
jgi:hypothetical protein